MANSIKEVMESFEELPIPKLSKLLFLGTSHSTRKEAYSRDRLEITENTQPGWYEVNGKSVYINNYDIPKSNLISAGGKRGTFTLKSVPHRYDVKMRQVGLVPEESAFSEDNR